MSRVTTHHTQAYYPNFYNTDDKDIFEPESNHYKCIFYKPMSDTGHKFLNLLAKTRKKKDQLLRIETDQAELEPIFLNLKAKNPKMLEKIHDAYQCLWIRHNCPTATRCREIAKLALDIFDSK